MKIDKSWYIKPEGISEEISSGGVVVCRKNGETFVALTRENNYPGLVLPKGHTEKGENLQEAATREIEEETGLKNLNLVCLLGTKERLDFKKEYWKKTYYFLFIGQYDKSTKWFYIDNLPEMFWPEQKELILENRDKIEDIWQTY